MADYDKVMHKLDYLDDTKQQIKEAIIEKGQPIEEDNTFREYVDKIKQISDGDIELYNTIDEMNNDPKQKYDGDLAIVYNQKFSDLTPNISFSAIEIPKVIHIGSTSTSSRSLSLSSNAIRYASMYVTVPSFNTETNLPNGTFSISLNNDITSIRLNYSCSEDGLTYTFDNGTETLSNGSTNIIIFDSDVFVYDFHTVLTAGSIDMVFIGMFNVKLVDFQGLYQYIVNSRNDNSIYFGTNYKSNSDLTVSLDLVDWIDLSNLVNDMWDLSNRRIVSGIQLLYNVNNHKPEQLCVYYNCNTILELDDKLYITKGSVFNSREDAENAGYQYTKGEFDFINWTYVETTYPTEIQEITIGEDTRYYAICEQIDRASLISSYRIDYMMYDAIMPGNICAYAPKIFNNLYATSNYQFDYAYEDKYIIAPNQFSLNSNKCLTTGKTALGVNGIYEGDGTYLDLMTTKEYKDYFIPELPSNRPSVSDYVLQHGSNHKYFTFVEREELDCTYDTSTIPTDEALTIKLEPLLAGEITNDTYKKAYSAQYHRTFFTKNNNKLYYGYFGYNMSDKESNSESGGIVHEEFRQIYGVLVCLDDLTVVKEVNYTNTWRPFNGYGNWHEDPNANIIFLNYDFIRDEFVIFVDTGTWAWNSSEAPFIGMIRINGTTNAATTKSWKIGRNSVPRDYARVQDLRYDMTTQKLILPLNSFNRGGALSIIDRILKMDLSGNKTMWFNNNGKDIYSTDEMGGDESFYIFEPIYYYSYVDETDKNHHILKRIDNDKLVEVPNPYSMDKSHRVIYNNCLYYVCTDQLENGKYPLMKVNLETMTYETYGEFNTYTMTFVLLDNKPHIVYGNALYDIDDLTTKKYTYYNNGTMYNDVRIDGVEYIDNSIQGVYPKAINNTTNISFQKNKQIIHHWKVAKTFPVQNDLGIIYPSSFGNNIVNNKESLYNSLILSTQTYKDTIRPKEFQNVLDIVDKINGEEISLDE